MPIRGEVGEDEKYDAVSASKCICLPRVFVVPACSYLGGISTLAFEAKATQQRDTTPEQNNYKSTQSKLAPIQTFEPEHY
jgi:hypothetical protein